MTNLPRRSSALPLVLIAIGLALILGTVGWYVYQLTRPELVSESVPITEENNPDVPRVSLGDSKAAYATGSAVFVDVRDAESYGRSHIPGALSIPLGELPDRMGEMQTADWIITYCT